jgi:uncharacterized membrane protein YdjX (TVP38/TMEM64 family)
MRSDATRIITLLLFATALLLLFQYRERLDIEMLNQWLVGKGWKAPVFFILAYATATVFFLPGTVMTLAGGALFGPFWGTLYNLAGATLGAGLAFLVARYLAGDTIRMRLRGRTGRLLQGVEEEGWRFVAFARLVPLFPFNLLNYALGLTHISFTHYLVATLLFMLPGTFAYTWLGFAGREAAAGSENLIRTILITIAVLAAAAFLPRLVKRWRKG